MTTKDIAWLAGILEGEGSFVSHGDSPKILVSMVDRDIINRVARLFKINPLEIKPRKSNPEHQTQWLAAIHGDIAAQWMMTIYSFMGGRRQTKIKELLDSWKEKNLTAIYYVGEVPWCKIHNISITGLNIEFGRNNTVRCAACIRDYKTKGVTVKDALCRLKSLPA